MTTYKALTLHTSYPKRHRSWEQNMVEMKLRECALRGEYYDDRIL